MTCGSCGVRNVDFASTCFSCRRPLGTGGPAAPRRLREALEVPEFTPKPASRGGGKPLRVPGGTLARLVLVAAAAWLGARGLPLHKLLVSPDSGQERPDATKEVAALPVTEPAPQEPVAPVPEEQNGFRLMHFEWGVPPAGPGALFRVGETVSGRSEIQGFGVTADRRIDVTVTLAFRDPTGKLVEPVSPTVLRQPVESETLFTTFDYAVPADAPGGDYELEMAVDDAVSTRSARFHRRITVEATR
jgi:hypothetical protein